MGLKSFHDLVAWQKAMDLTETIYRETSSFPRAELYGLTSQMRRASVSVPSNIAEGQARNTRGEFLQFLGHAAGSLAELDTQANVARRRSFVTDSAYSRIERQIHEVGRLLNGLKRSLRPVPQRNANQTH
jgi:four helix bundle protein